MRRHFITVEWGGNGFRGVFCCEDGTAPGKDEPFTLEEMDDLLDPFSIILSPESREMSEVEIARYNCFLPLAEYSKEWGIALTTEDFDGWWESMKESARGVNNEPQQS